MSENKIVRDLIIKFGDETITYSEPEWHWFIDDDGTILLRREVKREVDKVITKIEYFNVPYKIITIWTEQEVRQNE